MYAVPAAVTMGNASKALADLQRAIDGGESDIDLRALAHSDSSALAVVLAALRYARAAGKVVRVSGTTASMQSLAHLYGVEGLLQTDPAPAA